MNDIQSLRHTVWECKYHVVWVPKYRRKSLYEELRRYLGEVFHDLARPRGRSSKNPSPIALEWGIRRAGPNSIVHDSCVIQPGYQPARPRSQP